MTTDRARLQAELAVAELEEALRAYKPKDGRADVNDPEYRDLKQRLREARLRYRAARDGQVVGRDERGRLVARPNAAGLTDVEDPAFDRDEVPPSAEGDATAEPEPIESSGEVQG